MKKRLQYKGLQIYQKKTQTQVLSCEYGEFFEKT